MIFSNNLIEALAEYFLFLEGNNTPIVETPIEARAYIITGYLDGIIMMYGSEKQPHEAFRIRNEFSELIRNDAIINDQFISAVINAFSLLDPKTFNEMKKYYQDKTALN